MRQKAIDMMPNQVSTGDGCTFAMFECKVLLKLIISGAAADTQLRRASGLLAFAIRVWLGIS